MRIAYFDCFSGISGDMALGALLGCGGSSADLVAALRTLPAHGWRLDCCGVTRSGISAQSVSVVIEEEQRHGRHLSEIHDMLRSSQLPSGVTDRAIDVFTRLAEAEARIHDSTAEAIHFHEVGALDAIVDIVGSCWLLHFLHVDRVVCSPLPMGRGFVKCMHGTIPLPAPAVLELLKGRPVVPVPVDVELVTPTGAALVSTLASGFGPMPAMVIAESGYGAGRRELADRPNLLRVVIGDEAESADSEVVILEANIDNMPGEWFEYAADALFEAGALDVFFTPIIMKKSRPAVLLSVICATALSDDLAAIMLAETTTLGVRRHAVSRTCLDRHWVSVSTPYGPIRVKVGRLGDQTLGAIPEYEDVRRAALESSAPVKEVWLSASAAYRGGAARP